MSQKQSLPKEIPVHRDKLGRKIELDDFVCYPSHNNLDIGKVVKLNPKMVSVSRIPDKYRKWGGESRKYSCDLVLVEGKDVTMYILRNSA
jgi:hypothetical protein